MVLNGLDTTMFSAEAHIHVPQSRRTISHTIFPQQIKKRPRIVYGRPGLLHVVPMLGPFVHLIDGLCSFPLL